MEVQMKLKFCPFCGDTDIYPEYYGEYITGFHCPKCGAFKPVNLYEEYSPEISNRLARGAWNKRFVDLDEMEFILELMEDE